ncbi:WXG100-like domain-containing protein [Saccharopolyspora phatthalungensis]|uniref:Outer membrane channel protein CpnT-like N-terminal domain-containing protein n=1 Tax=Saccharopolyspora phatthalungensis TaxID=664693 RepID=A0A840QDF3_9PSEU|nr:hypothetical protein [Saccharopolyspora phatthalungensis]MBB5156485.1 hypothetical protein [Saccharopolyspora phatthalungensis]
MSIVVPAEVRRLFQVLTGEDMTDADEDALLRAGERLLSGAVTVAGLAGVLGEVVGRVRGEFSGKAADRFSQRVGAFAGVLESSGGALRELGAFVRDLGWQVKYLKFVTVGGLLLLLAEIAWAVAMAGATGGASMAWLAARMAVMRFLLSRWWGQLFMRLAVSAGVGVGLNVLPDVVAQGVLVGEGKHGWSTRWTRDAAGVGAMSAAVGLPMSALGNVVGKAVARILVTGLGDQVDRAVLAAAARRAAEEHAQSYPVSGMARFADVVAEAVDSYAGMSVRGLWAAQFGRGLGESVAEGLTEMVGELVYGVASGQGVQLNPFSFTAGVSESVSSGAGRLTGLAVRGELIPPGTRYRGQPPSEETTPLVAADSEPKTGDGPGVSGTGGAVSDVDSAVPESNSAFSDPVAGGGVGGFWAGVAGTEGGKTGAAGEKSVEPGDEKGVAEGKSTVPDDENGSAEGKVADPGKGIASPSADFAGVSRPGVVRADGDSAAGRFDDGRATTSAAHAPGTPGGAVGVGTGAGIPHGGLSSVSASSVARGQAAYGEKPDGPANVGRDVAAVSTGFGAAPVGHPVWRGAAPDSRKPPHDQDLAGDQRAREESTKADGTVDGSRRGTPPSPYSHEGATGQVQQGPLSPTYSAEDAVGQGTPPVFTSATGDNRSGPSSSNVGKAGAFVDDTRVAEPVRESAAWDALRLPSDAVPVRDAVAGSVAQWSVRDLRREIDRARMVAGPREPALLLVQHTHDVTKLVDHNVVSVAEVVDLVAARRLEHGLVQARNFSRELAAWLGTEGNSLPLRAGAGSDSQEVTEDSRPTADESVDDWGAFDQFEAAAQWASLVWSAAGDEALPWPVDPLGAGQSLGVSGNAFPDDHTGRVSTDDLPDVVAAEGDAGGAQVDLAEVWAEVRRAEEAGEPHTGATLAKLFGKSGRWGNKWLADYRRQEGDVSQADVVRRRHAANVAEVWAEVRRADEAGEPHTGPTLGAKFGRSESWGYKRLVEFRRDAGRAASARDAQSQARFADSGNEDVESGRISGRNVPRATRTNQTRGVDLTQLWAEVRRAEEAGEPHTGATLANLFGKSGRWGNRWLSEFRQRQGGASQADVVKRRRASGLAGVWAEVRRAEEAGERHTGPSLGAKFGKSTSWGTRRLAEFRQRQQDLSQADAANQRQAAGLAGLRSADEAGEPQTDRSDAFGAGGTTLVREDVWADSGRARDARELHAGASLGNVFGRSMSWGYAQIAEFRRREDSGSALEVPGSEQTVSAEATDVIAAERSGLVAELVGLVGSLRGLLVGAPEGYRPGLRARVEEWSAQLERGGVDGAAIERLRRRVGQAAELVERVRADRSGWNVDEGEPVAGVDAPESGVVSGLFPADVVAAGSGVQGEMAVTWGPLGLRDVAVRIVQGTHDVVRLARAGSLDAVVDQVAQRVREFGRAEGLRFSRELALTLGTQGTGLAVRAGGGPDSPAGAENPPATAELLDGLAAFGPVESEPVRAFLEWAESADDTAWPADPVGIGPSWAFGWGDIQYGQASGALADLPVGGTDVVAAVPFPGDVGGLPAAGDVGGPALGAESSGHQRGHLDDLGDEDAESDETERQLGRHVPQADAAGKARDADLEDVWAEVRRAEDAGKPHTGATLAANFGRSTSWGLARLRQFRAREGNMARPQEVELEDVWAELRRAEEARKPHTGATLAAKFGRSTSWGKARLAEFRRAYGRPTARVQYVNLEDVWAELSRAEEAGNPPTGAVLGAMFGRSWTWGKERLAEYRRRQRVRARPHEVKLEDVWAELRRAAEADEQHTGRSLGAMFGRSGRWGSDRLAEFRARAGAASQADMAKRRREAALEDVWAELRRARAAGETYTGQSLADKFKKSRAWGNARLAEFRRREGGGSVSGALAAGPAVPTEGMPAEDVGVADDQRPELASELVGLVGTLRGLLVGAPEGYRPGLQARVEEWSAQLERCGFDGVAVEGLRTRVGQAAELVERVWTERFGVASGFSRAETTIAGPHAAEETAETGAPSGSQHVAAGIVRGTHDVMTLANEDTLDGVVDQFAEMVPDFGHDEALPFSRELGTTHGTEGGVSRTEEAAEQTETLLENVWAELRRARDAGQTYSGQSLAAKFKKSRPWGVKQLAEFRKREGGLSRAEEAAGEREVLLENVWAELRRARDAGKPHTHKTLGEAFNKSARWGGERLAEFRAKEGGPSGTEVLRRAREEQLEQVWAEVRRADEAGQPHSGRSLGEAFGKGAWWGGERLAEYRAKEGGVSRSELQKRERAALVERAWAELRRARDAGLTHTGRSLGALFGKGASWGGERIAEFRAREKLIRTDAVAEREAAAEEPEVSAEDADVAERSRLVSDLVGLLASLRELLVDAPEGYRPVLRARVDVWWTQLDPGELENADVERLRRRVGQAAELVERVRTERSGWHPGGSAVAEGSASAVGMDVVEAGPSGPVSAVSAAETAGSVVHSGEVAGSRADRPAGEESARSGGAGDVPAEGVDEFLRFDQNASESARDLLAWASALVGDSWSLDPSTVDWSFGPGVDMHPETEWSGASGADTAVDGFGPTASIGESSGHQQGAPYSGGQGAVPGLAGPSGSSWSEPANRESGGAAVPALQQEFEAAERMLGSLDQEAVHHLLAEADKILGPLQKSARFRYVMAHRLLTHPGDVDGARALRERLVGYLIADADLDEWGRLIIAAQASGLSSADEVRSLVQEEARAEAFRKQYTGKTLGQKYNRNESWGGVRIREAKSQLTFRCRAAADSLRELSRLAPAEYRNTVNRQIVNWSNIASNLSYRRADVVRLRQRADAAAAADAAIRELLDLDGAASEPLNQVRLWYGDDAADGLLAEARERLGSVLRESPAFQRVMAHRLLTAWDDPAAIETLRNKLQDLMTANLSVSAGARPAPEAGAFLPGPGGAAESVRSGHRGDTTGEAEDSDVDGFVPGDELGGDAPRRLSWPSKRGKARGSTVDGYGMF